MLFRIRILLIGALKPCTSRLRVLWSMYVQIVQVHISFGIYSVTYYDQQLPTQHTFCWINWNSASRRAFPKNILIPLEEKAERGKYFIAVELENTSWGDSYICIITWEGARSLLYNVHLLILGEGDMFALFSLLSWKFELFPNIRPLKQISL